MKQHQIQTQKQLLKFSPQQIQMLNLLQLTTIGIEQKIKDELEENPLLEEGADDDFTDPQIEEDVDIKDTETIDGFEDDFSVEDFLAEEYLPDYKTTINNTSRDEETIPFLAVQRNTFQEQLKEQLLIFELDQRNRKLIEYLVDSLDDDGYLRSPIDKLTDDLSFLENDFIEESELNRLLHYIKLCDPAGIGAQSLKECLLLQLKRIKSTNKQNTEEAIYIVQHFFSELSNKNYDKIVNESGLSSDGLKKALKVITHLNPKPVSGSAVEEIGSMTIIPEFQVTKLEDDFEISLTNQNVPSLRINKKYVELIDSPEKNNEVVPKRKDKQARKFIRQKLNAARWFIDAIKQREQTMMKTMKAIVELQREFFISGDMKRLKPMILKDVAEKIGMDISTASRVTSTKYVQTQYGIFLLKGFFSTALPCQDGLVVSNKELQMLIAEMVDVENKSKPYTDIQITERLKSRGFLLARRTVAKYREKLHIPIARLRTELT